MASVLLPWVTPACVSRASRPLPELGARPTLYNTLGLIAGGEIIAEHRKCSLPNYEVFDERRYFQIGDGPTVVPFKGRNLGLLVCEDVWIPSIVEATMAAGADCLLVSNGSPYHRGKWSERASELAEVAANIRCLYFTVTRSAGRTIWSLTATLRPLTRKVSVRLALPCSSPQSSPVNWIKVT